MDGLLDQRVAQKAESKSKTWMKVPGSFLICVPKWKSTDISMALPPGPAGKYVIFSWTSASFFFNSWNWQVSLLTMFAMSSTCCNKLPDDRRLLSRYLQHWSLHGAHWALWTFLHPPKLHRPSELIHSARCREKSSNQWQHDLEIYLISHVMSSNC